MMLKSAHCTILLANTWNFEVQLSITIPIKQPLLLDKCQLTSYSPWIPVLNSPFSAEIQAVVYHVKLNNVASKI
jgi:hypothetical protein